MGQALVSSGNYSPSDFTSNDVQPSELCSQPVPRRREYICGCGCVCVCMRVGVGVRDGMSEKGEWGRERDE